MPANPAMPAKRTFNKNYLYELPEEIQTIIYKKAFKETLNSISDMRESLDNYDKLIEYIKNNKFNAYKTRAIWSIILCYKRDVGDPYINIPYITLIMRQIYCDLIKKR